MAHLLASQHAQRIQVRLRQHGWLTVFAARFVPGTRVPTYLLAGAGGVRPLHFLMADGAAALISVPLIVYLGYRFGRGILVDVERIGRWALLAVAIVGLFLLVRWALRRASQGAESRKRRA
jgi:membrane protein DedA with SNARE-associated domain